MTIGEVGVFLQGVGMVGTMVLSALAFIQSRRNNKQLNTIHTATNSLVDKLVASTKHSATSEGIAQGRQLEKDDRGR